MLVTVSDPGMWADEVDWKSSSTKHQTWQTKKVRSALWVGSSSIAVTRRGLQDAHSELHHVSQKKKKKKILMCRISASFILIIEVWLDLDQFKNWNNQFALDVLFCEEPSWKLECRMWFVAGAASSMVPARLLPRLGIWVSCCQLVYWGWQTFCLSTELS